MLRNLIFLITTCCSLNTVSAQADSTYYVHAKTLNLRSTASQTGEVVHQLGQYDNLTLLEKKEGKAWIKVQFKGLRGYVSTQFIRKGKAIVTTQSVRNGANCRDGSTSTATGRGACSHHGGVSSWRYETIKRASIIKNE